MSPCSFCDQIAGRQSGDQLAVALELSDYRRTVLAENALGVVMPSIGPLCVGHVLICPKRHARSFASLGRGERAAAGSLMAYVENALLAAGAPSVVAFEHGSDEAGARVACSIEHAHTHVLPWPRTSWSAILPDGDWSESPPEELADTVRGGEYLRVRLAGEWRIAVASPAGFESQLMRKKLAGLVGNAAWDWKRDPQPELIRSTVAVFAHTAALAWAS